MRTPSENILYREQVSSKRTQALFLALMLIFLTLFFLRVTVKELDLHAGVVLFISTFFLFYVLNYRTLIIQLTTEELKLKFGIFSWRVSVENIADCRLDQISGFMRYGGAGIHFMLIEKRYRASFNFLEGPRVVVAFKKKMGPVRDLSFSTRREDELIEMIRQATSTRNA